jgi:hypothetical protein
VIQIPQSTARVVMLKVFEEGTTTAATGETVAVVISKAGAAFGNPNAGATNATEVSNGWYKVTLDTTDTGTLGDLVVRGTAAGCDDAERVFGVVKATTGGLTALPDALPDAAGGLPVSDAGGLDLDALRADVAAVLVDTGTTLQAELDGIQADTEDIQARLPAALVGGRIDANAGAWAGGDLPATTDLFGTVYLRTRVTNVEFGAITATSFAAGAIGVTAIAAGAIGSDQLDSSAVAEIQAGLATAADLATVAGYLDTEVAAIKAKTDTLPAAPAAVGDIPTAAENAAAWGTSVVGNGRTRDYFLQGGTNLVTFAADGLSWTLYATDDATPLQAGTATRLAASVGGLRGVDPT